jgi:hypothetical protein
VTPCASVESKRIILVAKSMSMFFSPRTFFSPHLLALKIS